jgi:hypothetical protein
MDIPKNDNKKTIALLLAALLIGLILGALASAAYYRGKIAKIQSQANSAQSQASNKTGPGNIPAPPEMPKIPVPAEVTSISGIVEKIEGQTLTVKAFFFGEQKTYAVTVGNATKIQKSEMKKEVPKPEEGKPFEPFTLTDASFADIRQNDSLNIEAGENIKDKTSFEAKTVNITITNLPAPLEIKDLPAPPVMPDLPAPPSIPEIPKP